LLGARTQNAVLTAAKNMENENSTSFVYIVVISNINTSVFWVVMKWLEAARFSEMKANFY
jgi:hypothetical protein